MKSRIDREALGDQPAAKPNNYRDPVVSVGLGLAQTGVLLCMMGGALVVSKHHPAQSEPTEPQPNFNVAEYAAQVPVAVIDCTEQPKPSLSSTFDAVAGAETLLGIGEEPNGKHDSYEIADSYLMRVDADTVRLIPYIGGVILLERGDPAEEQVPLTGGTLTVDVSEPDMVSVHLSCD
jgi:hypothetical protein